MSRVSMEEKGLLSYAQAALILGVTPPRVARLVRDNALRQFDFFGRPYVSLTEVCVRRQLDLQTGSPKRDMTERLKIAAKMLAKNDLAQWATEMIEDIGLVKAKEKTTGKKKP